MNYENPKTHSFISSSCVLTNGSHSWAGDMSFFKKIFKKDSKQEYEKARQYYDAICAKLTVLPPDVMMQISGDRGNAGRLSDIVELFEHRFDPAQHGLMVGNNLIKG